jgi:hypothetical protein
MPLPGAGVGVLIWALIISNCHAEKEANTPKIICRNDNAFTFLPLDIELQLYTSYNML